MILYHGSKANVEKLEQRQASSPYIKVPKDELQNAIYLTPDYGFAVAIAANPDGSMKVDHDNKTVQFKKPEKFNPEGDIYIYTVEIPKEGLKEVKNEQEEIDELQYTALAPEVTPILKEKKKAKEVMKYFKLLNWEENKERTAENSFKIK